MDLDILPDGSRFPFWNDQTEYARDYHVAANHAAADDGNEGTPEEPLATLGRAAELVRPGQRVVVHEGVYRECVRPVRGGTGPGQMIAFETVPGEDVVIAGSELWRPNVEPSGGWRRPRDTGDPHIWMADLPLERFGAYNPFLVRNAYDYLFKYGNRTDPEWVKRVLLRRGAVYFNDTPLAQVHLYGDLMQRDGAFWVEEPGRIHFRLPGDADPHGCELEISAREQVFAPAVYGLGYIRVSGFHLRHAAGPLPIPQRGALSAMRGHHWIIENNTIKHVNGCGMDIGMQSWSGDLEAETGHHMIRNNRIMDCGVCGIAGARGVVDTILENNRIERIGGLNLELMAECASIKFHFAKNCLLRNNHFAHNEHAGGVWLDVDNENCRITSNVFADIANWTGAMYSEMNPQRNVVDHNIFWNIRTNHAHDTTNPHINDLPYGSAVRADCNENLLVAHNFFGHVETYGVAFTLHQADRRSQGRTGLCRANVAVNNVFHACNWRIHLGRREENVTDGNLCDRRDDDLSMHIAWPEPGCRQNLFGWREYFGLETNGSDGIIEAEFDQASGALTWRLAEGEMPACRHILDGVTNERVGPHAADTPG